MSGFLSKPVSVVPRQLSLLDQLGEEAQSHPLSNADFDGSQSIVCISLRYL